MRAGAEGRGAGRKGRTEEEWGKQNRDGGRRDRDVVGEGKRWTVLTLGTVFGAWQVLWPP